MMQQMNFKSVSEMLTTKQVFSKTKNITHYDKRYIGPVALKIMKMYFEIVMQTVLGGFAWKFPGDKMGSLYIKRGPVMKMKQERLNLKRIGRSYYIVLQSEYLNAMGVRFKALAPFKKRLVDVLLNTNKEYRTELS